MPEKRYVSTLAKRAPFKPKGKIYKGVTYDNAFDMMAARKEDHLDQVMEMKQKDPTITRRVMAKRLKVCMRTMTRYQTELRKAGRL